MLAVFFSPALLGPDQFLFRDTGRMHHPVKTFLADELRHGRLAQWNPYMGLGVPLAGTAVDAHQHPFNLLLASLPFELAFKAWVLLCYVLGGFGAFGWARRVGLSFAPALASGIAFALSGFLVSSSDNVTYLTAAASIPWVLWAFEAFLAQGGPLRLAALAAASWFLAAAGDPQAWGFTVGIFVLRGLVPVVAARPRAVPLRRTVLAAGTAAVAAAPVLLPVILWMPLTLRMSAGLDTAGPARWDLHPLRLLEFALPSLFEASRGGAAGGPFQAFAGDALNSIPWVASIYAGVACLALAVFALRRSGPARLLGAGALVLAWAATGHHLGFTALAKHAPVLGSFRYWEKLTVWPTLFLALAAGFGLEHLLQERRPARRLSFAAAAAAGLLLAAWSSLRLFPAAWMSALSRPGVAVSDTGQLLDNLQRAAGITGVILLLLASAAFALSRGVLARAAPLVFVGILTLDAASANVRAYLLAPPETVRPGPELSAWLRGRKELPRLLTPFDLSSHRWPHLPEFESTWRWGASTFTAPWNVGSRVGNFDSYTALHPERTVGFRFDAGLQHLASHVGLWGVQYAVVPGHLSHAPKIGLRSPFRVVGRDRELPAFVVELPHRPRVYLATRVDQVDRAGARAFALDPASVTSDRTVVEAPVPASQPAGPPGTATLVAEGTDRVDVEIDALRPALLVLNDQAAPGWRAEVDGREQPILTANYLVRGVWVDAGRHQVKFQYRAPGLRLGWLFFVALLGALGVWALALGVSRRRGPAGAAAAGATPQTQAP